MDGQRVARYDGANDPNKMMQVREHDIESLFEHSHAMRAGARQTRSLSRAFMFMHTYECSIACAYANEHMLSIFVGPNDGR